MNALSVRFVVLASLFFETAFTGCGRKQSQHAVEARAAHQIVSLLKWYQLERPGDRVTNLAQIFSLLERKYPYELHRAFRTYGKDAGFANSVFEKYIFVSPGLTNRFVQGEILMLNAQPVPDPNGPGRILISRVGTNISDYRRWWYPESQIQKIFAEAGVQIPKPVPMPAPPPPPPPSLGEEMFRPGIQDKVNEFFSSAAAMLGLGAERGGQLQWFTFLSLATVSVVCTLWGCWRWVQRRRRLKSG